MARASKSSTCVAATTTPIPPTPSTRSTRYLPAITSPGATSGADSGPSSASSSGRGEAGCVSSPDPRLSSPSTRMSRRRVAEPFHEIQPPAGNRRSTSGDRVVHFHPHRAVVAPLHVCIYERPLEVARRGRRREHVVDAPAHVLLPHAEALAPPRVV